jgi:tetratricopeptide (TPR) repeat protein
MSDESKGTAPSELAEAEGIPDIMDNYELVQKLGEGSFGEVWRARDLKRGEEVALKYLRLDRVTKDYLEMFKHEFEILSEIRHRHLALVFDFGYSHKQQQYFFTSEFCIGREFLDAAEGKPIDTIEEMLVQILSALDYVHSQGIVHFDIKSENIIVSEEEGHPLIKILDFGVASKLKSLPSGVVGTPSYMAPEIILEGAKVDHRADLYSVGILLLRTLTKRLPFDVRDTDAVLRWHLKGELPEAIWEGVACPRYMKDLVAKLLQKNAADRFSSARVALHYLNMATVKKYQKAEQDLAGQIPREGPLVEREEVLAELRRRLDAAFAPSGGGAPEAPPQICTIFGVQGIGKSRIIGELRRTIQLKELPFLDLVCNYEVPVWPKIEQWLGAAASVSPGMNEDWQMRARADAFLTAARQRPFALLADDFHKADRITKAVIPLLAERLARSRREGNPVPLFVLLGTEETSKEGMGLRRLSAAGITEYITLVLGAVEQAGSISKLLFRYSGGLPLLMVEGLRFLAPHLAKDEPLENLLPPPQIGLLYRGKIEALKGEEHEFLSILALLFRPAREEELANIMALPPRTIARLADACARSDLLGSIPSAEGEARVYQISSQALSLDIIRSIEPARSKELHGRIAAGLTKTAGTPLNEIAYFTAKSGDVERAIAYYREASADFKKQLQLPSATDCLVKAINICPTAAPVREELIKDVAQLLIVAGSYREAEGYLAKIGGLISASVEELRGNLHFRLRALPEAREHYARALELTPAKDRLARLLLQNSIGNVEIQVGNYARAIELFQETLAEEQELPEAERRTVHNNSLGLAFALTGKTDEAVAFYEGQLKKLTPDLIAEEISLVSGMGYVLIIASRYEEAIPYLMRAVELSEKTGAMHSLFSSIGNLVSAFIKEARYADALPYVKKMGAYQERLGNARDISYNLLREGTIYLLVGMEEAAKECFARGRKLSQGSGDLALAGWFLLLDGYRERDFGDPAKAEEFFRLTALEASEQHDATLAAWVHAAQADLAFDLGDREECRRHLDQIEQAPNDEEFRVRIELLRAKLAAPTFEGDADALFSPIEAECVRASLHELLWEVYHFWARAHLERHDRMRAIIAFTKAMQTIQTIAHALPEEYRDRYLSQRERHQLFIDFKELSAPTPVKKGRPALHEVIPGAEAQRTFADRARSAEDTAGGPRKGSASDGTIATGPKRAADKTLATGPKPQAADDSVTEDIDAEGARERPKR